ncbi:hypothetical protein BJ878DRAFT_419266 [Calycina marina]|uniref:PHD-type domain-containing protein n=1 Tax=Calycina marina TaxID=1763456 RepID=A0A9P8CHF1_9HELO|nr:hypothetical protein BJ878DRAFT_419266 [Calycina marina]
MEPAIPSQKPSFAEAGNERQGVVANMAALGTMPSAKLLKAASRETGRDTMGIQSGPSSVGTPQDSMATPEPYSGEQYDAARRPSFPFSRQASISRTEEPDINSRPASAAATPAPPAINTQTTPTETTIQASAFDGAASVATVAPIDPYPSMAPTPSRFHIPSTPQGYPQYVPSHFGSNVPYNIEPPNPAKVVELAVQFALDENRLPTAYAIRTLFDQQRSNPRMMKLFEAIYSAQHSDEQMREFMMVMRHKKKEGRRNNTALEYWGDSFGNATPRDNRARASSPTQAPSEHGPSIAAASPMGVDPVRRSSITVPHTTSAVSPSADEHVSKKIRANNYEPSDFEMNDEVVENDSVKPHQTAEQVNRTSNATDKVERSRSDSQQLPRSRSMSTSSSLSSVDDTILRDDQISQNASPAKLKRSCRSGSGGGGGQEHGVDAHTQSQSSQSHPNNANQGETRFVHANANAATGSLLGAEPSSKGPSLSNQIQPTNAGLEPGPKTFTFSTVTTSPAPNLSSSSTNHAAQKPTKQSKGNQREPSASAATSSAMPSATTVLPFNPINKGPVTKAALLKKQKADANKPPGRLPYDENDKTQRLKREVRRAAAAAIGTPAESYERTPLTLPQFSESAEGFASDDGGSIPVLAPSKAPTRLRFTSSKRPKQVPAIDDESPLSSPTVLGFQKDLAPGSLSVSRAGTPNFPPRASRKSRAQGTGIRVKTSPMKKKGATAGLPKPNTGRSSPIGTNFPGDLASVLTTNLQENDDYCSCCSGSGELVCCDGCTRSFHYTCADPPVDKSKLSNTADWFCNVCTAKEARKESAPRRLFDKPTLFGSLLARIEIRNPESFTLPKEVRERFENVKTGADGEYEEFATVKPRGGRIGWDEAPDYFRLKDSKGNVILCHQCNQRALHPDRAILPCHFCHLSWHLDCINPPMSKEPTMGKPFRCPAHIDDILTAIPDNLWPAHRHRKVKNEQIMVAPTGCKNNGYIEVENNIPSDKEDNTKFNEVTEYGRTYKLPEDTIKLNFIEKVRNKYGHLPRPDRSPKRRKISHPSPQQDWADFNLDEQQAAINLTSVAYASKHKYHQDTAKMLIQTLLNQAPENVVALMAQGAPDVWAKLGAEARKLTTSDTQALIAMKALINERLKAHGEPSEDPKADASKEQTLGAATSAARLKQGTPARDTETRSKSNGAVIERSTEQQEKPNEQSEAMYGIDTSESSTVKTPGTIAVQTPNAGKDVEPDEVDDGSDGTKDPEMLV